MSFAHFPTPDDVIVVAVTGHAGAALATDLLTRGHRVAVAGSSAARLIPIVNGHSDKAVAIVADLGDPGQVASMLERVAHRLGPVTVMTDPGGAFGSTPWHLHSIAFSARDRVAA